MTDPLSWMPLETMRDLGWTLIHFLWQGLLLAALLNAALPFCRSAAARHNGALITLVLMGLAPVMTFAAIHGFQRNMALPVAGAPASLASASSTALWLVWLVVLWFAGIAVLSLRAVGGWYLVQTLRRDTSAVPAGLLQRCALLQRRMAMTSGVRFRLSRRIDVPMVAGVLRPVILIPVSALAGLAPQQLEALILHELAHIRRLDPVTNILLAAVETVLFYHPAVWWVGRQLRLEREHACDDLAVSACGDAVVYAEALASLESWKVTGAALAANGGRLKSRVARLLEAPVPSARFSPSAIMGLALASFLAASLAVAAPSRKDPGTTAIAPIQETHQLPPYPAESLHLKEEGRVLVEVTIGTDGTVSQAVVVGPSGHQRLDVAAANFVKGYWRWQPATRQGKPVTTKTRVSVLFKLKPDAKAHKG